MTLPLVPAPKRNSMNYFAHSGNCVGLLKEPNDTGQTHQNRITPPQRYEDHILGMLKDADRDIHILQPFLQKAVRLAIMFHDIGKLAPSSQSILSQTNPPEDTKLVNHVDAGVAICLKHYHESGDLAWIAAAHLIHAHHIGLKDRDSLYGFRTQRFTTLVDLQEGFRDTKHSKIVEERVDVYSDQMIESYWDIHMELLGSEHAKTMKIEWQTNGYSAMEFRMAMSILVDSDHTDTGNHYYPSYFHPLPIRAAERHTHQQNLIRELGRSALAKGMDPKVVESRGVLYRLCGEADLSQNHFFVCTAPTGKGKTHGLMRLALRVAEEKKKDRIHFVIPFTNIISQSVQEYRNLALDGEARASVVNEIHNKVEFSHHLLRAYSQRWSHPINVGTSVQFYGSITSNHPSTLRKLRNFANSVIVLDEYHQSLPHHLWKVALVMMRELSEKFNIDFIFGSGTHVYYWNDTDLEVMNVIPNEIFEEFRDFENHRIDFRDAQEIGSEERFHEWFSSLAVHDGELVGSTLLILNTIKNAVSMTMEFKRRYPDWTVYHMSSNLTPHDREIILEKVKTDLKVKKILLVATSVVECGVDFSFDIGFREYASMMSTIQFGGRVNRNLETALAPVYEFKLSWINRDTVDYSKHPGLTSEIAARTGVEVTADNCTHVVNNILHESKKSDLVELELNYAYQKMADAFVVIENLTETVIVDGGIVSKLQSGAKVTPQEINRHSVSVYRNKLDEENKNNWLQWIKQINDTEEGMYYWTGPYDPDCFGISEVYFERN